MDTSGSDVSSVPSSSRSESTSGRTVTLSAATLPSAFGVVGVAPRSNLTWRERIVQKQQQPRTTEEREVPALHTVSQQPNEVVVKDVSLGENIPIEAAAIVRVNAAPRPARANIVSRATPDAVGEATEYGETEVSTIPSSSARTISSYHHAPRLRSSASKDSLAGPARQLLKEYQAAQEGGGNTGRSHAPSASATGTATTDSNFTATSASHSSSSTNKTGTSTATDLGTNSHDGDGTARSAPITSHAGPFTARSGMITYRSMAPPSSRVPQSARSERSLSELQDVTRRTGVAELRSGATDIQSENLRSPLALSLPGPEVIGTPGATLGDKIHEPSVDLHEKDDPIPATESDGRVPNAECSSDTAALFVEMETERVRANAVDVGDDRPPPEQGSGEPTQLPSPLTPSCALDTSTLQAAVPLEQRNEQVSCSVAEHGQTTAPAQQAEMQALPEASLESARTTGSDRSRESMSFSAAVCVVCDAVEVQAFCEQCLRCFCASCDATFHSVPRYASHVRRKLQRSESSTSSVRQTASVCHLCDAACPSVWCQDCELVACADCDIRYHNNARFGGHLRTHLALRQDPSASDGRQEGEWNAARAQSSSTAAERYAVHYVDHGPSADNAIAKYDGGSTSKHESLCGQCDSETVVCYCLACRRCLCSNCDTGMHAAAAFREHERVAVELLSQASSSREGQRRLSKSELHHARGDLSSDVLSHHSRAGSVIVHSLCRLCDNRQAHVRCRQCSSLFCEPCDISFHCAVRFAEHQRMLLDSISGDDSMSLRSEHPAALPLQPNTPPLSPCRSPAVQACITASYDVEGHTIAMPVPGDLWRRFPAHNVDPPAYDVAFDHQLGYNSERSKQTVAASREHVLYVLGRVVTVVDPLGSHRIYNAHAGEAINVTACPVSHLVASSEMLGDGTTGIVVHLWSATSMQTMVQVIVPLQSPTCLRLPVDHLLCLSHCGSWLCVATCGGVTLANAIHGSVVAVLPYAEALCEPLLGLAMVPLVGQQTAPESLAIVMCSVQRLTLWTYAPRRGLRCVVSHFARDVLQDSLTGQSGSTFSAFACTTGGLAVVGTSNGNVGCFAVAPAVLDGSLPLAGLAKCGLPSSQSIGPVWALAVTPSPQTSGWSVQAFRGQTAYMYVLMEETGELRVSGSFLFSQAASDLTTARREAWTDVPASCRLLVPRGGECVSATGRPDGRVLLGYHGKILSVDAASHRATVLVEGLSSDVVCCAAHPVLPLVTLVLRHGPPVFYDVARRRTVPVAWPVELESNTGEIVAAEYCPKGDVLAISTRLDKLLLFNLSELRAPQLVASVDGNDSRACRTPGAPHVLAFSSDGELAAWSCGAGVVVLAARTGAARCWLRTELGVQVLHMQFANDPHFLITNDNRYIISTWDTSTGQLAPLPPSRTRLPRGEPVCPLGWQTAGLAGNQDFRYQEAHCVADARVGLLICNLATSSRPQAALALYSFPCTTPQAAYFLHHLPLVRVNTLRFCAGSTYVIACGSNSVWTGRIVPANETRREQQAARSQGSADVNVQTNPSRSSRRGCEGGNEHRAPERSTGDEADGIQQSMGIAAFDSPVSQGRRFAFLAGAAREPSAAPPTLNLSALTAGAEWDESMSSASLESFGSCAPLPDSLTAKQLRVISRPALEKLLTQLKDKAQQFFSERKVAKTVVLRQSEHVAKLCQLRVRFSNKMPQHHRGERGESEPQTTAAARLGVRRSNSNSNSKCNQPAATVFATPVPPLPPPAQNVTEHSGTLVQELTSKKETFQVRQAAVEALKARAQSVQSNLEAARQLSQLHASLTSGRQRRAGVRQRQALSAARHLVETARLRARIDTARQCNAGLVTQRDVSGHQRRQQEKLVTELAATVRRKRQLYQKLQRSIDEETYKRLLRQEELQNTTSATDDHCVN